MKSFFYIFIMGLFIVSACTGNEEILIGEYQSKHENGFPITLVLDNEGHVYGKVVNNLKGLYETQGDKIIFKNVATTMMMGPPEGMKAEDSFLKFLKNVETFSQKGEILTLITNDAQEMTFEKSQTK